MRDKGYKRRRLYKEQGGICYYCKKQTPFSKWTIDHIEPKRLRRLMKPKDLINNLVGACRDCNQEKGDTAPKNFNPYSNL